ncbi:hypothetical protein OK006_7930 [Actinobacteria bacterium OK006]|nr:hypothetical protein OK006_7930 [Actinobacteria bacterium OK006]
MITAANRPILTAQDAQNVVRRWRRRLVAGASLDELTAQLANGMRLELPDRTVRGHTEFAAWYRSGPHRLLADLLTGEGDVEVTLSSPVHAQVTVTSSSNAAGAPPQQEWWVVLQDRAPRIRTVTVTGPLLDRLPDMVAAVTAAPQPAHV